jgi:hypothetical protein
VNPTIERAEKHSQHLFFTNKIWEITAEGIKEIGYNQLANNVWSDNIINAEVSVLKPLVTFSQNSEALKGFPESRENDFTTTISSDGKKSHFLRFLINTSLFHCENSNTRTT